MASIRDGIEDDGKGRTVPEEGESAAARAMRMLPGTEPTEISARRATVTQEVTIKGNEAERGGEPRWGW